MMFTSPFIVVFSLISGQNSQDQLNEKGYLSPKELRNKLTSVIGALLLSADLGGFFLSSPLDDHTVKTLSLCSSVARQVIYHNTTTQIDPVG